jgi:hypothetical protein
MARFNRTMKHANDETANEAEAWLIEAYKEAERRVRARYDAELAKVEKAERVLLRQAGADLALRRRYQERADALLGARNALDKLSPTLPEIP